MSVCYFLYSKISKSIFLQWRREKLTKRVWREDEALGAMSKYIPSICGQIYPLSGVFVIAVRLFTPWHMDGLVRIEGQHSFVI